jgi:hypothetical protein
MGLAGSHPKPDPVRPDQSKHGGKVLNADGYHGESPPLPGNHFAETVKWYETWRHSPQAELFIETDWLRLHLLAQLVDALYDDDTAMAKRGSIMAEIRNNEKLLGATVADRGSLYLSVRAPAVQDTTRATPGASSRRRTSLLNLVTDTD